MFKFIELDCLHGNAKISLNINYIVAYVSHCGYEMATQIDSLYGSYNVGHSYDEVKRLIEEKLK